MYNIYKYTNEKQIKRRPTNGEYPLALLAVNLCRTTPLAVCFSQPPLCIFKIQSIRFNMCVHAADWLAKYTGPLLLDSNNLSRCVFIHWMKIKKKRKEKKNRVASTATATTSGQREGRYKTVWPKRPQRWFVYLFVCLFFFLLFSPSDRPSNRQNGNLNRRNG